MKKSALLGAWEKLEAVAQRLPGPLKGPILKEITPVKEMFLKARPARILLLGPSAADASGLVRALIASGSASLAEAGGAWVTHARPAQGALDVLDGRRPLPAAVVRAALAERPADLALYVSGPGDDDPEDFSRAAGLLADAGRDGGRLPRVLGVAETDLNALHAALGARPEIAARLAATVSREPRAALAARILRELPVEARLDFARLAGDRDAQAELAQNLVKSVAGICGAIGTQPIPLADFPIITSLQVGMVTGVIHIAGLPWNRRRAAEFLGAIGANVGVGLVLREAARAGVKLLPGWGNALSGGIAGFGTYAVGRAAIAYFIRGATLREAKRALANDPA